MLVLPAVAFGAFGCPQDRIPCRSASGAEFCSLGGESGCHASGGTPMSSLSGMCPAGQTACRVDGEGYCVSGGTSGCNALNGDVVQDPNATQPSQPSPSTNTNDNSQPSPTDAGSVGNSAPPGTSGALINPLGVNSLPELLNAILKGVVQIGSILLVLAIVYVGFLFVFARGDTEQIKNARNALLWTVIGGILLLGAQAISMVIQATVQNL